MAKKKKYCRVLLPFKYKGKRYEVGKGIYLKKEEKEILINKNLIR